MSIEVALGGGPLPRPDLPGRHPQNVPLDEWTDGWLKLGVAAHAGHEWLWLNEHEKRGRGLPADRSEMVAYLVGKGDVPAAGISRSGSGSPSDG